MWLFPIIITLTQWSAKPFLFFFWIICGRLSAENHSQSILEITCSTVQRLSKCYDGHFQYTFKGTNGKQVGVSSATLVLLALTTPHQFLESVVPKIVARQACQKGLSFSFNKRTATMGPIISIEIQGRHLPNVLSRVQHNWYNHSTTEEPQLMI